MKHWVAAYRRVPGSAGQLRRRLRTEITDLLRSATDAAETPPASDGSVLVQLPAHVAGRDVRKQVRVRIGVALDHGDRTVIPLQWEAEPGRHAFPTFTGTIELEPLSSLAAQITVVGAVTPPLGPVGAVIDATMLGPVAERTVDYLADRLAAALRRPADEGVAMGVPEPTPSSARMVVADIMTPDPLVLNDDLPLKTAALLLFHFGVAGAPVTTADGGLVGVLSEADLLAVEAPMFLGLGRRASQERRRALARTVGEACSSPARVVTPEAPVSEAARLMQEHRIARLVVVSGAEVVGVVSRHDVLRAVMRGDVDTRAAVEAVLHDLGAGDVAAEVTWGIVAVSGVVDTHSHADRILAAIDAIDGVIGVDADLRWKQDDLIPPPVAL